jgi:hypothetical protein
LRIDIDRWPTIFENSNDLWYRFLHILLCKSIGRNAMPAPAQHFHSAPSVSARQS